MNHRDCPLCGGDQVDRLYRPVHSPGAVTRCRLCGMIYIADIEDAHMLIEQGPVGHVSKDIGSDCLDPEAVAEGWEPAIFPEKELEWPALRQNAMDALQRLRRAAGAQSLTGTDFKYLDFGCGLGFALRAAGEMGWELYGLEPLAAFGIYARLHSHADVVIDILHDNTFPANTFHAVSSFQVFEHLPQPRRELVRLYRMIVPGGLILIEVPDIDTWSVNWMRSRHRHFVMDHINFFSAVTLKRLLTEVGFEPVQEYRPTRRMTVRHLVSDWGGRMLGQPLGVRLAGQLNRLHVAQRIIPVNLGDIVAVIARKPER